METATIPAIPIAIHRAAANLVIQEVVTLQVAGIPELMASILMVANLANQANPDI
jgi:hypothetical protein